MNMIPIEPSRRKLEVLSHLQECTIFHFAGHGHTDVNNPSESRLILEDGEKDALTVANLLDLDLRSHKPFLAYLSACGTGRIEDMKLAAESTHLIGACQVVGFRHVIGTLWEVDDQYCVDMARLIYKGMRDGGMTDDSVCRGLHNATRALRDDWLGSRSTRGKRRRHSEAQLRRHETDANSVDMMVHRLPRNVITVEDEDDGPLHWVPYVHFGV
jgi:CHAT domain-containing protein